MYGKVRCIQFNIRDYVYTYKFYSVSLYYANGLPIVLLDKDLPFQNDFILL